MMRAEARADVCELPGSRIVDREVAAGAVQRKSPSRGMARARFAERWVVGRAHGGGDPHATAFVEHRVVDVVLARPAAFVARVRRLLAHGSPFCWLGVRVGSLADFAAGDAGGPVGEHRECPLYPELA